jgi:hypothetical protein
MQTKNKIKNRGLSLIGLLVILAILLIVLGYFNISVRNTVEGPVAQDNVGYVWGTIKNIWIKYIEAPASYLWNDIWINIFWKSFILNMERIRDGKSTIMDTAGPRLNF